MKRREIIRDISKLMKDVDRYILGVEFTAPKLDEKGQPLVDEEGWPKMETKTDLRPWLKPSLRSRLTILEEKVKCFSLPEKQISDMSVMQSVLCETQEERNAILVQQTLLQRERESEETKLITA